MKKIFVYLGGFLPLCVFSQLLYEPFEYNNNTFVNATELWQHHSGTLGQMQINNGKLLLNDRDNEDVHFVFEQPLSSLYYSFTLSVNANSETSGSQYFAHLNTSAFKAKLFITYADGGFIPGIATYAGTPTANWGEVLAYDVHYRIVVKYDGTTTLWVNPNSEMDFSISDPQSSDVVASEFCFRQAQHPGSFNASVDDLFIATSFFEVLHSDAYDLSYIPSISIRNGVVLSDDGRVLGVYNTMGQKVKNKDLKGVYIVYVSFEFGHTKVFKIIAS
jgi:hypothetical protein